MGFECVVGSRTKVMNGTCLKTSGGLEKKDLKYNKYNKIVSKKASKTAQEKKNLGVFLIKKGKRGFDLMPKKGTPEYKNKLNKGSRRCPNGSRKSKSGKSCLKVKKSNKGSRRSKKCPKGSRKSKSGKSCRKK